MTINKTNHIRYEEHIVRLWRGVSYHVCRRFCFWTDECRLTRLRQRRDSIRQSLAGRKDAAPCQGKLAGHAHIP